MVTLTYNPISGINFDKIKHDIETQSPDSIIICNELEWELKSYKEIIQICKQNNVDLKIIFGSFDDEYYDKICLETGLDKSNLIFWSTFWINWSEICLRNEIDHKNNVVDSTKFKYPFICLNNKNHLHRQVLIDHLAKYNLIDKGIVTWHKFMNAQTGYQFKYYDDSVRVIDDDFSTKLDSFLIPKQWNESFLHVVGEATLHTQIISEKVIIPILLKKPFAALSKKGYNKFLQSLGFKLYDELIDYSYDDCNDLVVAADVLCKSISNMPNNYVELYETLRPKLEYNYQRCLEIIHDKNNIPDIIKNLVLEYQDKPVPNGLNSVWHRYQHMLNNCYD